MDWSGTSVDFSHESSRVESTEASIDSNATFYAVGQHSSTSHAPYNSPHAFDASSHAPPISTPADGPIVIAHSIPSEQHLARTTGARGLGAIRQRARNSRSSTASTGSTLLSSSASSASRPDTPTSHLSPSHKPMGHIERQLAIACNQATEFALQARISLPSPAPMDLVQLVGADTEVDVDAGTRVALAEAQTLSGPSPILSPLTLPTEQLTFPKSLPPMVPPNSPQLAIASTAPLGSLSPAPPLDSLASTAHLPISHPDSPTSAAHLPVSHLDSLPSAAHLPISHPHSPPKSSALLPRSTLSPCSPPSPPAPSPPLLVHDSIPSVTPNPIRPSLSSEIDNESIQTPHTPPSSQCEPATSPYAHVPKELLGTADFSIPYDATFASSRPHWRAFVPAANNTGSALECLDSNHCTTDSSIVRTSSSRPSDSASGILLPVLLEPKNTRVAPIEEPSAARTDLTKPTCTAESSRPQAGSSKMSQRKLADSAGEESEMGMVNECGEMLVDPPNALSSLAPTDPLGDTTLATQDFAVPTGSTKASSHSSSPLNSFALPTTPNDPWIAGSLPRDATGVLHGNRDDTLGSLVIPETGHPRESSDSIQTVTIAAPSAILDQSAHSTTEPQDAQRNPPDFPIPSSTSSSSTPEIIQGRVHSPSGAQESTSSLNPLDHYDKRGVNGEDDGTLVDLSSSSTMQWVPLPVGHELPLDSSSCTIPVPPLTTVAHIAQTTQHALASTDPLDPHVHLIPGHQVLRSAPLHGIGDTTVEHCSPSDERKRELPPIQTCWPIHSQYLESALHTTEITIDDCATSSVRDDDENDGYTPSLRRPLSLSSQRCDPPAIIHPNSPPLLPPNAAPRNTLLSDAVSSLEAQPTLVPVLESQAQLDPAEISIQQTGSVRASVVDHLRLGQRGELGGDSKRDLAAAATLRPLAEEHGRRLYSPHTMAPQENALSASRDTDYDYSPLSQWTSKRDSRLQRQSEPRVEGRAHTIRHDNNDYQKPSTHPVRRKRGFPLPNATVTNHSDESQHSDDAADDNDVASSDSETASSSLSSDDNLTARPAIKPRAKRTSVPTMTVSRQRPLLATSQRALRTPTYDVQDAESASPSTRLAWEFLAPVSPPPPPPPSPPTANTSLQTGRSTGTRLERRVSSQRVITARDASKRIEIAVRKEFRRLVRQQMDASCGRILVSSESHRVDDTVDPNASGAINLSTTASSPSLATQFTSGTTTTTTTTATHTNEAPIPTTVVSWRRSRVMEIARAHSGHSATLMTGASEESVDARDFAHYFPLDLCSLVLAAALDNWCGIARLHNDRRQLCSSEVGRTPDVAIARSCVVWSGVLDLARTSYEIELSNATLRRERLTKFRRDRRHITHHADTLLRNPQVARDVVRAHRLDLTWLCQRSTEMERWTYGSGNAPAGTSARDHSVSSLEHSMAQTSSAQCQKALHEAGQRTRGMLKRTEFAIAEPLPDR